MGITNWITSKFTVDTSHRLDMTPMLVRGAFDDSRLPDWYANRTPNWAAWDNDGLRSDAVRKSIIVFACATYLADAVAEASIAVEYNAKNEWAPAQDRASASLDHLLKYPNPHMSESEMLSLLVMQMAVQGYAVVEKVRNGSGLPVQLWPLRPDWLAQRRDSNGGWTYEYRSPGLPPRPLLEDDLCFIPWRLDDRMERHGIGPVQVAGREIGIDAALTDFLKSFLDAGGIPPFVLSYPDPINDESIIEAMQERWRQKYGGSKAWGELPVLHGGYSIDQVGLDINAMAWPDLRAITELKICQVFRVPPDLVGAYKAFDSGNLTTTEAQGAMEQLQRYGASPLRRTISGALGRELLPEFGLSTDYRLVFDTSEVLALQEDVDKKHARIRADYDAGILMLDEARIELDRKELPQKQGQVFKVPFNIVLTPAAELLAPPEPTITEQTTTTTPTPALPAPAKADRKYRDVASLDAKALELRSNALSRVQRDRAKLEVIGTRHLRKFFKEQGERLLETIMKSDALLETRDIEAIDWDEEFRQLDMVLRRFYMANGEAAFATASAAFDLDSLVWEVSNPRVLQLMDHLGLRITNISETTRKQVIAIITQWLIDGAPLQTALIGGEEVLGIADHIRHLFTETYAGRAKTIARTESQVAYNLASAMAYQESGEIDDVELHDSSTHCEDYGASDGLSCCERNGMVVPLQHVSRHVNAEHVNGSLAISPVLRTPLGEE